MKRALRYEGRVQKDLKRLDAGKGSSKLDVDVEAVNSLRNGPTPVVAVAHSRAAEELWWARENSNL
jgi:hypothetical protein